MGSFVENVNKVAALIPAESVDLGVVVDNIDNINLLTPVITDLQSIVDNVVPNIAEILLADDNASTATTQAGEASASASQALGYRNEALDFRNEAEAFNESKAFVVDTVEDLLTIPSSYVTATVRDLDRGDTFIYDATKVSESNDGTNFSGWIRQYSGAVNVKWFGAKGDGVTDDTVAIQNAINYSNTIKARTYIPSSKYYITSSLLLKNGTQIYGDSHYQYGEWGSSNNNSTVINFNPSSLMSLFVFDSATVGSFRFNNSIQNINLNGNSIDSTGNSLYAIDVDSVIYANFVNISISKTFRTAIKCTNTIQNRFENVFTTGWISCVEYSTLLQSTTDTWEQCTFFSSPKGVVLPLATGVRFNKCIFEQLVNVGAEIYGTSMQVSFTDCYAENVPFNNASGYMFKVGANGSSYSNQTLDIKGGVYFGSQFVSTIGTFLYTDFCYGVSMSNINVTGYLKTIEATDNTLDYSLRISNLSGTLWGAFYTGAANKLSGIIPSSTTNANYGSSAILKDVTVSKIVNNQGNIAEAVPCSANGSVVLTLPKPRTSGIFSLMLERGTNANANSRAIYFVSNRYGSAPQITQIGSTHAGALAAVTFTIATGVDGASNQTITITDTSSNALLVYANYSGL